MIIVILLPLIILESVAPVVLSPCDRLRPLTPLLMSLLCIFAHLSVLMLCFPIFLDLVNRALYPYRRNAYVGSISPPSFAFPPLCLFLADFPVR